MWPFSSNKTLLSSGVFKDFTDCHSHILPDVDDGTRTMKRALQILSYFEELGFKELWCTPHIMEDFPNTPTFLKERFEELCGAYSGSIKLRLSAEHMLDYQFLDRLSKDLVIPYGPQEDMLLVETSYFNAPSHLDDMLWGVRSAGFFPVMAHPERYNYMSKDEYNKHFDNGVKFQLNILSLCGFYGPAVRKKAEWMLESNMYSFTGTDIHSLSSFQNFVNEKIKVKCISIPH